MKVRVKNCLTIAALFDNLIIGVIGETPAIGDVV